jgi:aspartate aminotransferase-like enzyme
MFGPNTHLDLHTVVRGSHRDRDFKEQLQRVDSLFKKKFDLSDFTLLYLLGGGTLGIETLVASSRRPIEVVGVEGTFKDRWRELVETYSHVEREGEPVQLYCQVETSVSEHQICHGDFVDAVSSFPYFPIPTTASAFVTSSNKQLGSYVGLCIVGIRTSMWDELIRPSEMSYLSLSRYRDYLEGFETPSTTATYIINDLERILRSLDLDEFRTVLDRNCLEIVQAVGVENVIGMKTGPVLTVKQDSVPEDLALKWNLYRKPNLGGVYQIFTYSCASTDYQEFAQELRDSK